MSTNGLSAGRLCIGSRLLHPALPTTTLTICFAYHLSKPTLRHLGPNQP